MKSSSWQTLGLTALVCCFTLFSACAGGSEPMELPESWLTNFNAAKAKAKQTERPILLIFTGSDWCPPCIAMEKKVLSTERFQKYADENLVVVYADFPRRGNQSKEQEAHNEKLAAQFGVQAFPTYLLLSADQKLLTRAVGMVDGGPEGFITMLEEPIAEPI